MSKNKLKISIGSDDFFKMVTEHDVFVDKSLFIKEIITASEEATLITKPRRWGKTLNLHMLKTFLAHELDEKGNPVQDNSYKKIFEGGNYTNAFNKEKQLQKLAIAEVDNGFYMQYQGKYPVIFISFKDVIGDSISEVENKLKLVIKDLFKDYRYILKEGNLERDEILDFEKILDGNISKAYLERSIKFLTQLLYKHHGQKVYVLVDEYDKPVNQLLEQSLDTQHKSLVHQVSQLLTSIFSSCGKTNPALEKIVLTGIFDTLKKEGGSGFNNVNVFSIMDARYSKYFGFSENEVNTLIEKLGFEKQTAELAKHYIKHWYNGYNVVINDTPMKVYIPWSVMNYLNNAYNYNNFIPENYWTKSGSSVILQNLLKAGALHGNLIEKFSKVNKESEVKFAFDKSISLFKYELTPDSYNEKIFTYLLVNSGYLTLRKENNEYKFSIPNQEVKTEFSNVIELELENSKKALESSDTAGKSILVTHIEYLISHKKILQFNSNILSAQKAILDQDSLLLKNILDTDPSIKGNEHYNFFSLGAISGNKDIVSILLDKCNNTFLSLKDNYGLKPIDYAYLFNKTEIIDAFQKSHEAANLEKIPVPGYPISVYCYQYTGPIAAAGILAAASSASLKYFMPQLAAQYSMPVGFTLAIFIEYFSGVVKHYKSQFDENICQNYKNYHNISDHSLLGFKVFLQLHQGAYVTTDPDCRNKYQKINSFTLPLVNNKDQIPMMNDYQKAVDLNLCEPMQVAGDMSHHVQSEL